MSEDTKAAEEAVAKELQGRVEEFNKELLPLLGKYELGLGASAFINPNGTIGARPIMFDARKEATAARQSQVEKDNAMVERVNDFAAKRANEQSEPAKVVEG